MKYLTLLFTAVLSVSNSHSQMSKNEILLHRTDHLSALLDSSTNMLSPEEIENFQGLDYFDFDPQYQITARLKKSRGKKFEMATSTDRKPMYRRYGYIIFTIDGVECQLEVYQNIALKKNPEYKNYLFIPFKDETTALSTYGGGRFLETEKSKGKFMPIDFNLAFNPYCCYSYSYSCPIPPKCNTLKVNIKAGEKTPLGH